MSFQEISIEDLHSKSGRILIDVRSPGEYAEGTIPDAINIPLFTDEERAQIGTVYKQQSPAAARRMAMLTVSPKIPQIVEQMEPLLKQGELVIFCWRGGMRSFAACTFMDLLKYPVLRLRGGYRAYRQMVLHELERISGLESPLIVLHGLTGVGKSRALEMLQARGHQILDLEKMANHRGSVFGSIGLGDSNNQKKFDSLLWETIRTFDAGQPIFMEAESRRIGRSVMPEWLEKQKYEGVGVLLKASLETRVRRLMEDYLPEENERIQAGIRHALQSIQRYISAQQYAEWADLLDQGDYHEFCTQIMANYYDPKYMHTLHRYQREMTLLDAEDLEQTVQELELLAEQVIRDQVRV